MKPLLSVSRRTDIPAFYAHWWLRCLRQGFCRVPNPVSGRLQTVDLDPSRWAGMVFWTRNPAPLLPHLEEIDRLFAGRIAWQFTLNAMPPALEARTPSEDRALALLVTLADRYGARSVSWRFDPVLLTGEIGHEQVLQTFTRLASRLEGRLVRCITSFADDYAAVGRNLRELERRHGIRVHWPGLAERRELAERLAERAAAHGLELQACCESDLSGVRGITPARCLDVGQLAVVPAGRPPRENPTREGCHCHDSRDPGTYDSCPHGCVYCYANRNPERPRLFNAAYRRAGQRMPEEGPESGSGPVTGGEEGGPGCRTPGKP